MNAYPCPNAKTATLFRCLAGVLLLGRATASAQTIVNPSFEAVVIGSPFNSANSADVPGWVHTGGGDGPLWGIGYSDSGGSVTIAGAGSQFVTMGGGGSTGFASWSQTVAGFVPGQDYVLSFKMASETNDLSQSIQVAFPAGSLTPAQTFNAATGSSNYWQSWEQKSMTFTPNNASVTIEFSATVLYDVGLDDVKVTAVPEPATWAAVAGMGALGLGLRRRRFCFCGRA